MNWSTFNHNLCEKAGLFNDCGNRSGTNGLAAFANGKLQTGLHGDGGNQLDGNRHVIARHTAFRRLPANGLRRSRRWCGNRTEGDSR